MSRRQIYFFEEESTKQIFLNMTSTMTLAGLKSLITNKCPNSLSNFDLQVLDGTGTVVDIRSDEDVSKIRHGSEIRIAGTSSSITTSAEKVNIEPHYETLTSSGLYAYYDSAGYYSLNFAIGELIDNALSATMKNDSKDKTIEVRLYKDSSEAKSVIMIVDNGHGMNKETLTSWAKYKFAKHRRIDEETALTSQSPRDSNHADEDDVRFLNGQISKFGAGGKESAFYIGKCVRVVTKNKHEKVVHSMELSVKLFEEKEKNKEHVFEVEVKSRAPGTQFDDDDTLPIVKHVTKEEEGQESFTYVIISDLNKPAEDKPSHLKTMYDNFESCAMQLSDLYHYYVHGNKGDFTDDFQVKQRELPRELRSQNIIVEKYNISSIHPRDYGRHLATPAQRINLRDVHNGRQTTYIRNAVSTFEFKGHTFDGKKRFGGMLWYYNFKYDKETFPGDVYGMKDEEKDDKNQEDENNSEQYNPEVEARGSRDIFFTYWNGRLIPYTTLQAMEFCQVKKSTSKDAPPEECYSRVAGVLFCDDAFKVTQNKLTFQDNLESMFLSYSSYGVRCKDQGPVFEYKDNTKKGDWTKRGIEAGFQAWLNECHKKFDKKIKFLSMGEVIHRTDNGVTKENQFPWTQFKQIEWDRKKLSENGSCLIQRGNSFFAAKVHYFVLQGDWKNDYNACKGGNKYVYGSRGWVACKLEPFDSTDELSYFPLSKVNMNATAADVQQVINRDLEKFPHSLEVISEDYEEEKTKRQVTAVPLRPNQKVPAGTHFGPFKVDILDRSGKSMNGNFNRKKLAVELQVIPIGSDKPIISHSSLHHKKWQFWFAEMNTLVKAGKYKLIITSSIHKLPNQVDPGIKFPSLEIPFEVVANEAQFAVVPPMEGDAFAVGDPFDYTVTFMDAYDNPVSVAPQGMVGVIQPKEVDWQVSVEKTITKGDRMILKNVVAKGKIEQGKTRKGLKLNVFVRHNKDLTKNMDGDFEPVEMEVKFKSGHPASLQVFPEGQVKIENGTLPDFGIKVMDICDNLVTKMTEENLAIQVKFFEMNKNLRRYLNNGLIYMLEIPHTGPDGTPNRLVGGPVIKLPLTADEEEKTLFAEIIVKSIAGSKAVTPVVKEVVVTKCTKPTEMRVYYTSEFDENIQCEVRNEENLFWTAGETIKNITFKMFDDTSNEITTPSLTLSNFRISWLKSDWLKAGEYTQTTLKKFKLPDIRAPRAAGEESAFSLTYLDASAPTVKSVRESRTDNSITFLFHVKSTVGVPKSLKVTCSGDGDNRVPAGEVFPRDIIVKLVDKYDNVHADVTEEDLDKLEILCESAELVPHKLEKDIGNKGEIVVNGIMFGNKTSIGDVNVKFIYDNFLEGVVILKVVAGPPMQLEWKFDGCEFDSSGTLPCYNRCQVGCWTFQLKDNFGNNCHMSHVPITIGWHKNMTGHAENVPVGQRLLTGIEGRANFGKIEVMARGPLGPCPLNICGGLCYGALKVRARAELTDGSAIMSAGIKIHLMADPFRAVKFAVECDDLNEKGFLIRDYHASGEMPEFRVRLIAEDEGVVRKGNFKSVVMFQIWNNDQHKRGSAASNEIDEETSTIFFRPRAPIIAGNYRMWFVYQDEKVRELQSAELVYRVLPAEPHILSPSEEPIVTSYVSNTSDIGKRLIAKRMIFRLKDIHGNHIPGEVLPLDGLNHVNGGSDVEKYNGSLVICIDHTDDDKSIPLPQLDTQTDENGKFEVPIRLGVAQVDAIHLKEKSTGQDMAKYRLVFKPIFSSLKKEVPPYTIEFGFVNEGAKQEKLMTIKSEQKRLYREKVNLESQKTDILKHQEAMKRDFDHAINDFNTTLNECRRKHEATLTKLTASTIDSHFLSQYKKEIDEKLKKLVDQDERESGPNSLHRALNEPGILGKIAHLAKIEDPRDNEVISWCLRQDMDCIVTETVLKTKELQKRLNERQQFLPLELARRIKWDEVLPHQRCKQPFNPSGHPVFARHLLHFPVGNEDKCKLAFGGLLADTIIIDTMDDAMEYRSMLTKQGISCPVIVTRDNKRLAATGKVGGTNNFMSDEFRSKGVKFAKTPSKHIVLLRSALQDITDLIEVSEKRDLILTHQQQFVRERLPTLKALDEQLFRLNHQLRELEEQELEVTRKRPATATAVNQPPLKRFC